MNDQVTAARQPTLYRGVMISSTFRDLERHRQVLAKALNDVELMHVAMENVPALADAGVISSSLAMVEKASAYILIIGTRYGQIPKNDRLNPNHLSITELEFLEAQRLERPTLLFLMERTHPIMIDDVDLDSEKQSKLEAFRAKAIKWHEESDSARVYASFDSLEDFGRKATAALVRLRQHLSAPPTPKTKVTDSTGLDSYAGIRPPALYANPPYLGSHSFVGRRDQIRALDEWAQASDPHSALLFEAIGGSGKSILAWHWLTTRSTSARGNWAGRFWYSFYERGAQTKDFLLRALEYMHGTPSQLWQGLPHHQLIALFAEQLQKRPWLFVLDGVERLLVDYNRFDAEYRSDDQAGTEDLVSSRSPLAMIREEDSQLFRSLLTAAPSKLLITSRLLPRCMVNRAQQPLPGLRHHRLTGLTSGDAEMLFRSCGAFGESNAIRSYLAENCDCHPLVIGILAGMICRYLPARGDFDQWRVSAVGGLALDLSKLDLVSRRNHILRFALDSLPEQSRDLLAKLALLLNEFDYKVLVAFRPEQSGDSKPALEDTVEDLETHGFLLFDTKSRLYDLHPVVRSVVIGSLADSQRIRAGEAVIDHFLSAAARPLSEARTFEDVLPALQVVQTYLKLGRFFEAWHSYSPSLFDALWLNLELHDRNLALIRAFFVGSWTELQPIIPPEVQDVIWNHADVALSELGLYEEATQCSMANYLRVVREGGSRGFALSNIASIMLSLGHSALAHRLLQFCLQLAEVECLDELLFESHLKLMQVESSIGNMEAADAHWRALDPLGRDWHIRRYRPGAAEYARLCHLFDHSEIEATDLSAAEAIASRTIASRRVQRQLLRLRGMWHLKRKEFDLAAACLGRAADMARASGLRDPKAEAAHLRAGLFKMSTSDAIEEATRLSNERLRSEVQLALVWEELQERDRAVSHAHRACEELYKDGKIWANRAELSDALAVFDRLGEQPYHCLFAGPRMTWPAQIDGFPPPDELFHDLEAQVANLAEKNKTEILRHKNTPISDRRIASRGHLIHKLKAKDTTGRWAYYFVLVLPDSEASFLKAIEGDGTIDLEDFGQVVASCYGEEPTQEVKDYLYEKYGFRV